MESPTRIGQRAVTGVSPLMAVALNVLEKFLLEQGSGMKVSDYLRAGDEGQLQDSLKAPYLALKRFL